MNGTPQQNQPPEIPPLKAVDSSHIQGAYHDRTTKTLYVGFHDGSVYGYQGVPEGAYQAMIIDKSPGAFFNARIKGRFQSQRLRTAAPKPKAPMS